MHFALFLLGIILCVIHQAENHVGFVGRSSGKSGGKSGGKGGGRSGGRSGGGVPVGGYHPTYPGPSGRSYYYPWYPYTWWWGYQYGHAAGRIYHCCFNGPYPDCGGGCFVQDKPCPDGTSGCKCNTPCNVPPAPAPVPLPPATTHCCFPPKMIPDNCKSNCMALYTPGQQCNPQTSHPCDCNNPCNTTPQPGR